MPHQRSGPKTKLTTQKINQKRMQLFETAAIAQNPLLLLPQALRPFTPEKSTSISTKTRLLSQK